MGERVAMTVKVDREVKDDFEAFVKEQKGQKYGEMGRMAERALQEYMDNDRGARVESKLDEVLQHLESEKEQSKKAHAGSSVREREDSIISALITPETVQVHRNDIEKAIRKHDLTSGSTIKKYIRNITDRPVFGTSRTPNVWEVNHDKAEEYY